jgi:hypothetical protein
MSRTHTHARLNSHTGTPDNPFPRKIDRTRTHDAKRATQERRAARALKQGTR